MGFKVGGRFTLTINGVQQFTGTSATYGISGVMRERVETSQGALAYTEMRRPGYIEVELLIRRAENLAALEQIEGATAELTLANGRTVRGTNMARIGEPLAFDAVAGTTTLRLEGDVIDAG